MVNCTYRWYHMKIWIANFDSNVINSMNKLLYALEQLCTVNLTLFITHLLQVITNWILFIQTYKVIIKMSLYTISYF